MKNSDVKLTVKRIGSEIGIVCAGCGRDMLLDRVKLEKAVKRITPAEK